MNHTLINKLLINKNRHTHTHAQLTTKTVTNIVVKKITMLQWSTTTAARAEIYEILTTTYYYEHMYLQTYSICNTADL